MDLLRCSPSNWLQHFWKSQSAIGVLFAIFVAVRHEGMIDTSLRHRSGSSVFQVQRTSASILNLQRLNTILELVNLCPIFLRNVLQIISLFQMSNHAWAKKTRAACGVCPRWQHQRIIRSQKSALLPVMAKSLWGSQIKQMKMVLYKPWTHHSVSSLGD